MIKICDMTSRSYFGKMNSTLGSVVPLAMFVFDLYQMMSLSDHEAVTSSLTFWRSLDGMGENKIKILSEMEAAPLYTRCLCSAVACMPIYLTKWLQRFKSVAHNGLWEL